jgi:molybdate/tungstate transport system substrate-binding protein
MAAATSVWIVVVIVVAAGVGGAGFFAGYEYRGSPAASPSATVNATLSILGAGTLSVTFPALANELVSQNPQYTAPAAAQTYEGSLDVTTAITTLAAKADVAALADFRLAPSLLEPTYASYEVVFAQTQEVLLYNANYTTFDGINASNWGAKLVATTAAGGDARLGIWNASTDPNGYNEIFSMMLQGELYGGTTSSIYGNFYAGAPGDFANPNPATTILEHESQAASLVETGVVSSVITYLPIAVQTTWPAYVHDVVFNPIVGLGANNSTALSDYAALSTEILDAAGGLSKVVPAPILFAATVPSNAPNAALGALFLNLLLSPQGSKFLAADGWTPISPGWADRPSAVPGPIAPDVTTLPSWAAPFLS